MVFRFCCIFEWIWHICLIHSIAVLIAAAQRTSPGQGCRWNMNKTLALRALMGMRWGVANNKQGTSSDGIAFYVETRIQSYTGRRWETGSPSIQACQKCRRLGGANALERFPVPTFPAGPGRNRLLCSNLSGLFGFPDEWNRVCGFFGENEKTAKILNKSRVPYLLP